MAKKEKPVSLKTFLDLASGKNSPAKLLETYKEFLLADEILRPQLEPIYARLEAGEQFPTAALNQIRPLVWARANVLNEFAKEQKAAEKLAAQLAKEELQEKIREEKEAAKAAKGEKSSKKYLVVILDENNQRVFKGDKPVMSAFELYQRAEGFGARRILEGADAYTPLNEFYSEVSEALANELGFSNADCGGFGLKINGWKAVIVSLELLDSNGKPIVTVVDRNRAMEILFPKPIRGAAHIKKPSSGLNISMCNVKGSDHCHFSHGLSKIV